VTRILVADDDQDVRAAFTPGELLDKLRDCVHEHRVTALRE
jgi:hypothetical protein